LRSHLQGPTEGFKYKPAGFSDFKVEFNIRQHSYQARMTQTRASYKAYELPPSTAHAAFPGGLTK